MAKQKKGVGSEGSHPEGDLAYFGDVDGPVDDAWLELIRPLLPGPGVRQQHGGPGPHKSGSSQDVHGDPGSGASTTSTPGKARKPYGAPEPDGGGMGPAGGYEVREATDDDFDSLVAGVPVGPDGTWDVTKTSGPQQLSIMLFDSALSQVLVDSDGQVQAHFAGRGAYAEDLVNEYEIPQEDIDYFSDAGKEPYILETLGAAPRNLEPGGERGWGLAAVREAVREARSMGCDFIFLAAAEGAEGFYSHIGFYDMGERGYPGYFVMSGPGMDRFEEAYDARFK